MQPVKLERRVLEKDVEERLVRGVRKLGGKARKWSSQNNRGVTDRVVILPGDRVWLVELKREGGRLSPLQRSFALDMARCGITRYVVLTGYDEVDAWLMARKTESFL